MQRRRKYVTLSARRGWRLLHKKLVRGLLPLLFRPNDHGLRLETLGSGQGTWTVPVEAITSEWVCYCAGVGVDATFDLALAERFGCRVYSFDPTPRSITYMEKLGERGKRLTFMPVGVWKENTKLAFFAPRGAKHVSHSVYDLHATQRTFLADCKTLGTLMHELGHERIDLLKLDIEGAWYEVVANALAERVELTVLCVEFDSPVTLARALRTTRRLRAAGFVLASRQRDNYLFLHRRLLGSYSR
jgi:FkbM family methyltransferase